MGIKLISPGKYKAIAQIKISGKQRQAQMTFERMGGERPADVQARAKQWIIDWRKEQKDVPTDSRERTVESMVAAYLGSLESKKKKRAATTIRSKRGRLQLFLQFSHERSVRYVWQISQEHCERYYEWLLDTHMGQGIDSTWGTLRSAISFEIKSEAGGLRTDPSAKIETRESDSIIDVPEFTDDELKAMYGVMSEYDRHLFTLLEWSGMRIGEVRNLLSSSVRVSPQTGHLMMYIERRMDWKPKTDRSQRAVPVMKPLIPTIEYFFGRNRDKRFFVSGDKLFGGSSIYNKFSDIRKKVIQRRPDLALRFTAVRDQEAESRPGGRAHANAKRALSPHAFRKTFGCRMLNAGLSFDEVGALLGHTSKNMTEIYASYSDNTRLQLASKVNALFGSSDSIPRGETKGETYNRNHANYAHQSPFMAA